MKTRRETAAVPEAGLDDHRALARRALRYCLGVFVALRIGLTLLGLVGVALLPHPGEAVSGAAGIPGPVGAPGWPAPQITPGWHNAVTSFERFDALWFLGIATDGYEDGNGSAAFFPGYPLLIRAVSPLLGGHPLAAALLISNLAAFGSMLVLYLLSARELDETVARRAVLYLAVFPTSFFLLAPYSEAPFLLFVLVSLWSARQGRWWLAGLAGAAAAATRSLGIVLVVALVAEAVHQWRERRPGHPVGRLAWALTPAAGLLGYLLYWRAVADDWLAPIHQQANWQRELSRLDLSVLGATGEALGYPGLYPGGYHLLDWLIVLPALAATVWVVLRVRPVYSVYAVLSLAVPLTFIFPPRPFMSMPRFLLAVFPLLWAPSVLSRRRPWIHNVVVVVSAVLLGVLTLLFVNWYYVF